MPSFTWHGHRLHYLEAGEPVAPLLVILPGSTASSASHAGELEYFARTHHVAALDFLGTGASPNESRLGRSTGGRAAPSRRRRLPATSAPDATPSWAAAAAARRPCWPPPIHPDEVTAVVADSCPEKLEPADLRRIVGGRIGGPAASADGDRAGGGQAGDAQTTGAQTTGDAGIADQPFPGSFVEVVWREGPRLLRKLVSPSQRRFWKQAHGEDWPDVVAADAALHLELADRGGWDPLAGRLGDIRCPVLLTSSLGDEELPSVVPQHQHLAMETRGLPALGDAPRRPPRHVE